MALKPTYLAFSDNPKEFSEFAKAHSTAFAPGVYIIEGDDALAIARDFAKVGGFTVYTIEVSVADIAIHK